MRILTLDIETSPNLAYVWGMWDQNIALNQLVMPTEMICFAAKWLDETKTMWFRGADMVPAAWGLLNAADAVIHFNGRKFDIPHLNREFAQTGLLPPAPYKQIDLLSVVKQRFRFPSNKLQYVSTALGLEGKADTGGFDLWVRCMADDPKAWKQMEKYNRQDVILTEQLYYVLRPWIGQHPALTLHNGTTGCPTCGSDHIKKEGFAHTQQSKFQRYSCLTCGRWFRDTKRSASISIREEVL